MENEKDYQGIANPAYNAYIIAYQSQFLTSVFDLLSTINQKKRRPPEIPVAVFKLPFTECIHDGAAFDVASVEMQSALPSACLIPGGYVRYIANVSNTCLYFVNFS